MNLISRMLSTIGSAKNFRAVALKAARGVQYAKQFTAENQANRFSRVYEKAKQGDLESQYEVAERYYEGRGIRKNYEDAALWFERAATGGHGTAQGILALMKLLGRGTERDPTEAAKWIELAVAQEDARAMELRQSLLARIPPAEQEAGRQRAREFRPTIWKAEG